MTVGQDWVIPEFLFFLFVRVELLLTLGSFDTFGQSDQNGGFDV